MSETFWLLLLAAVVLAVAVGPLATLRCMARIEAAKAARREKQRRDGESGGGPPG
ncbi:hypothetical protein [Thiohalorhabdus methylotrophus]|uniref:Uncharacterized protein n=1 Tax=Thiohalorhabdus methylotrophus TaxID=3242694 RepID=A0ABV4TTE8_9GAMM